MSESAFGLGGNRAAFGGSPEKHGSIGKILQGNFTNGTMEETMPGELPEPEQEWTSGISIEGSEGEEDLDRAGLRKLNEAVVAATDDG